MCVGGMRMSTTATSGWCMRTLRTRSSAVPAWATTSKPQSESSRATPSRRSTESSASTTRTWQSYGTGWPLSLCRDAGGDQDSGRSATSAAPESSALGTNPRAPERPMSAP